MKEQRRLKMECTISTKDPELPKVPRVHKLCAVTGAFLLVMPAGVQWFWGNLAVYVFSFYHNKSPNMSHYGTGWVTALIFLFRGTFFVISGYIVRQIGLKTTLVMGILTFNLGLITSHFALMSSIEVMNLTLGILCGVGNGLLYGPALQWVLQWSDGTDMGLVTAIIQSGFPCGAIIVNQFITTYLNPQNYRPDIVVNGFRLFSQQYILKRVPNVFLILCGAFVHIQVIGLVMLNIIDKRKRNDHIRDRQKQDTTQDSSSQDNADEPKHNNTERHKANYEGFSPQDFTPKQMFTSPLFYLLAFTYLLSDYVYLFILNYYKALGLLWISDDYFLTCIGTSMVMASIPTRVLLGYILDKIGVKNTLIGGYTILAILAALLNIASMVNKWLYLIFATIVAAISGSLTNAYTVAVVVLFGRKHSIMNIGWLYLTSLAIMLFVPPLMDLMVVNGMWLSLCISAAGTCLFNLILIVLFLPQL